MIHIYNELYYFRKHLVVGGAILISLIKIGYVVKHLRTINLLNYGKYYECQVKYNNYDNTFDMSMYRKSF